MGWWYSVAYYLAMFGKSDYYLLRSDFEQFAPASSYRKHYYSFVHCTAVVNDSAAFDTLDNCFVI